MPLADSHARPVLAPAGYWYARQRQGRRAALKTWAPALMPGAAASRAVVARYSQPVSQLAYPQASSARQSWPRVARYVHLTASATPPAAVQQTRVAALVLSHGANGYGGWGRTGTRHCLAEAPAVELSSTSPPGAIWAAMARPNRFMV